MSTLHKPCVGFDARLSIGQYRGMGRFTRTLISGHEDEFLAFCAAGERDDTLRLVADGVHPYPLWEQFSLPRLVRRHRVEYLLCPYNTAPLLVPRNIRLLLVVHDLIFLQSFSQMPPSRSAYQNLGRLYRRLLFPRALRKAQAIITVSEYTRKQLVAYCPVEAKVHVIPNTLSIEWFDEVDSPGEPQPYVLCTSGDAPSKNLARVLQAFALYQRTSGDRRRTMKIAGVRGARIREFHIAAEQFGIGDAVEFLDYLSEDRMRALYRNAELFIFPSLFEGFGIPLLEALACGTAAVASNRASLPEVGGDAARYFDPENIAQMAGAIGEVLSNHALREQMRRRGREQARKFHPAVVAEQVRNFWEELS